MRKKNRLYVDHTGHVRSSIRKHHDTTDTNVTRRYSALNRTGGKKREITIIAVQSERSAVSRDRDNAERFVNNWAAARKFLQRTNKCSYLIVTVSALLQVNKCFTVFSVLYMTDNEPLTVVLRS